MPEVDVKAAATQRCQRPDFMGPIFRRSSGGRIYGECRTCDYHDGRSGFSNFLRTSTVGRRITQRRIEHVRKGFLTRQPLVGRHNHSKRLLTLREREVLCWLARAKTNAEIGAILGISSATVGKHLEHIYPKLGVENRTAAASFASEATDRLPTEDRD
jgi:DNA-binding CsgD family transcriptional regulator